MALVIRVVVYCFNQEDGRPYGIRDISLNSNGIRDAGVDLRAT